MWIKLKEAIGKAVEKHIPHGKAKFRDNLPWVTPQNKTATKDGIR